MNSLSGGVLLIPVLLGRDRVYGIYPSKVCEPQLFDACSIDLVEILETEGSSSAPPSEIACWGRPNCCKMPDDRSTRPVIELDRLGPHFANRLGPVI